MKAEVVNGENTARIIGGYGMLDIRAKTKQSSPLKDSFVCAVSMRNHMIFSYLIPT